MNAENFRAYCLGKKAATEAAAAAAAMPKAEKAEEEDETPAPGGEVANEPAQE